MSDQEVTQEQIEEERLELHQRLHNTMSNVRMVKDVTAKQEAITACREAFMSLSDNSMMKFGINVQFDDARVLLDWADLVVESFG